MGLLYGSIHIEKISFPSPVPKRVRLNCRLYPDDLDNPLFRTLQYSLFLFCSVRNAVSKSIRQANVTSQHSTYQTTGCAYQNVYCILALLIRKLRSLKTFDIRDIFFSFNLQYESPLTLFTILIYMYITLLTVTTNYTT